MREYRERLWSPDGKWLRLGFFHLINRHCACHCAAHLPCHIDALQDAFPRLIPDRSTFWRLANLDGLSLAEAGLHIRAHLGWLTRAWDCLHMGNGSTAAPSGRRSEAFFPFSALISLATRSHDPWVRLRYKERRTCTPWSYGPAKTRGYRPAGAACNHLPRWNVAG